MAPEQATADPTSTTESTSTRSASSATRCSPVRPPFHGFNPQQTLAAHVTQPAPPLGQLRAGLSPALEATLMKCLAKRPADRYQNADDLVTALEPLATPSGGMTPTYTRPVEAVSSPSRSLPRWLGWVAGGALVRGRSVGTHPGAPARGGPGRGKADRHRGRS